LIDDSPLGNLQRRHRGKTSEPRCAWRVPFVLKFCDSLLAEALSMIWRALRHMTATEILTRVAVAVGAAILGSLGLYPRSPVVWTLAAAFLFLLIYRLRYKHL
jgi:hypothetical protein